jgi:hypothetical protein
LKRPERIEIGIYTISIVPEGVCIIAESGEGGIFSREEFLKIVDKFYAENF